MCTDFLIDSPANQPFSVNRNVEEEEEEETPCARRPSRKRAPFVWHIRNLVMWEWTQRTSVQVPCSYDYSM